MLLQFIRFLGPTSVSSLCAAVPDLSAFFLSLEERGCKRGPSSSCYLESQNDPCLMRSVQTHNFVLGSFPSHSLCEAGFDFIYHQIYMCTHIMGSHADGEKYGFESYVSINMPLF